MRKPLLLGIALAAIIAVAAGAYGTPASAQRGYGPGMMYDDDHGPGMMWGYGPMHRYGRGSMGYDGPHYGGARQRCAEEFRSFEWDTGRYTTYAGEKRLCPYLR